MVYIYSMSKKNSYIVCIYILVCLFPFFIEVSYIVTLDI